MAIPMYVTHQKTPVPTKKPEPACPPRETLEALTQTAPDVVAMLIEQHKLPLKIENGKLVDALKGTDLYLNKFITENPDCIEMKQMVVKLANCPDEVLITGATGTGKEIIARAMIGNRTGVFVAINCAGLPEHLVESELFGHVRGAFTGADSQKQGLFARASDGVMFLDEIGELPLGLQAKLLRAIQDKVIRRVGSNTEELINCKFVCATHRDLKKMTVEGHFREDLYARISTFELHIPSLSSRPEDIVPLILAQKNGQKFLDAFRREQCRIQDIDLTYNVRSIERLVKRFNVLGKIILP